LKSDVDTQVLLNYLAENNIKTVSSGPQTIRLVTHLDIKTNDLNKAESVLKNFKK
jgi:threonine aldolase